MRTSCSLNIDEVSGQLTILPPAMEEFEDERRIGGYDLEFVDELSRGQICPICLLAIRNPVQTACGHRFCETCLLETFLRGDHYPDICPECRNPLRDVRVFRDVAWEREILSRKVKCNKSTIGCDWTGELRDYEREHFVSCKYEDVKCNMCEEEIQRGLLHKHTTSECPNRMVQCEHCEKKFAFCNTKYHEDNECRRIPVNCLQCGEEGIPREEVDSHVKDDCAMTMVHCPFEGAGCVFYDQRRHLKAHLETSMAEHLSETLSKLLKTPQRLDGLEGVLYNKEEMEHKNSAEISDLRESKNELELEIKRLNDDMKRLQLDNKRLWNVIKGLRDDNNKLRGGVSGLRDDTDEVDVLRRQEKPPKVKSQAHRVYSAVVGKLGRKNPSKHASANVADSEELYDEVFQEIYDVPS